MKVFTVGIGSVRALLMLGGSGSLRRVKKRFAFPALRKSVKAGVIGRSRADSGLYAASGRLCAAGE
jgi:hypothetical protein